MKSDNFEEAAKSVLSGLVIIPVVLAICFSVIIFFNIDGWFLKAVSVLFLVMLCVISFILSDVDS